MAGEWGQVAQPLQAHTADLDEALALVSSVYCSHRLQLAAQQRQVNTRLQVAAAYRSSLVSLAYGVGMMLALTRQRPSTEMASIGDINAAQAYA